MPLCWDDVSGDHCRLSIGGQVRTVVTIQPYCLCRRRPVEAEPPPTMYIEYVPYPDGLVAIGQGHCCTALKAAMVAIWQSPAGSMSVSFLSVSQSVGHLSVLTVLRGRERHSTAFQCLTQTASPIIRSFPILLIRGTQPSTKRKPFNAIIQTRATHRFSPDILIFKLASTPSSPTRPLRFLSLVLVASLRLSRRQALPPLPTPTASSSTESSANQSKMCIWEEVTCINCGRKERQKMAYSCDAYRRHVYGPCQYDRRYDRDRVVKVDYTNHVCQECIEMGKYVNL